MIPTLESRPAGRFKTEPAKDYPPREPGLRHCTGYARTFPQSTGEKQPTNLNALADEYLKIAYHGLRAKDKNFNAVLVTDFMPDLGLIELAPQEIGRVLLNLYNNAFYAVNEKQKMASPDYKPTLTISTRLIRANPSDRDPSNRPEGATSITQSNGLGSSRVEIRIIDNGTGIPDSVKAKIFQPFFTTKPTGEGTGLGLSLSYDIITKGHGGSLLWRVRKEKALRSSFSYLL